MFTALAAYLDCPASVFFYFRLLAYYYFVFGSLYQFLLWLFEFWSSGHDLLGQVWARLKTVGKFFHSLIPEKCWSWLGL